MSSTRATLAAAAALLAFPLSSRAETGRCVGGDLAALAGQRNVEVYYHEPDAEAAKSVGALAETSAGQLSAYFGFDLESRFQVVVAADRAEYDSLRGKKSEWWSVGYALSKDVVVILSPRQWDARSRSYVDLGELVKHELAHAFVMQLNGKEKPRECRPGGAMTEGAETYWFDEGLATLLSGQLERWQDRVVYDFDAKPRFSQILDYGGYATAATAADYLLDRFGKDKVFSAIRALPAGYYRPENYAAADQALFAALGVPEEELEAGWRDFALAKYPSKKKR